jgi:hypothetical protein
MTRCEQTCGVKLVLWSERFTYKFLTVFQYEGSLCEKTVYNNYVARWGLAWPGLVLFGYLILSRKLSSVFPKKPTDNWTTRPGFENLKPAFFKSKGINCQCQLISWDSSTQHYKKRLLIVIKSIKYRLKYIQRLLIVKKIVEGYL